MPHGGGFVRAVDLIKIERQVVVLGLIGLIITGFIQANKYEVSHCFETNLFTFVGSFFLSHFVPIRQVYFLTSHQRLGEASRPASTFHCHQAIFTTYYTYNLSFLR